MPSEAGGRLARAHRALAIVVLNTVLAFVALNLVLALVLRAVAPPPAERAGPPAPGSAAYEAGVRGAAASGAFRHQERFFPQLSPDDVAALMLESWLLRPYVYEPFTQFREGPYRGRFVNVDPNGFRQGRAPAPWPPDPGRLNVFVFGGSTTFGYGLPDGQTVPVQLEDLLARVTLPRPVRVYNFGRGYYFSAQERTLFEQLLTAGATPDAAVFVDGLNDLYATSGEPHFTGRLRTLMAHGADAGRPATLRTLLAQLPVGRAAAWLEARRTPPVLPRPVADDRNPPPPAADGAVVERVLARYEESRRMTEAVAALHGVPVLFVWQPVPTYAYDLGRHPDSAGALRTHPHAGLGYARMAERASAGGLGPDFVWCADVQQGRRGALYIDQVHYTPAMARLVARCIARGLLRPPRRFRERG